MHVPCEWCWPTVTQIIFLPICATGLHAGADAEILILKLFQDDADSPSVRMDSIHFDKRASVITMTALDLAGCVCFSALYKFALCIM